MNILYTIVIKFKDSNTTASNVALFIIGRHMVSFSLILGQLGLWSLDRGLWSGASEFNRKKATSDVGMDTLKFPPEEIKY